MSTRIRCPLCGDNIRLLDDYRGQSVGCPGCGGRISAQHVSKFGRDETPVKLEYALRDRGPAIMPMMRLILPTTISVLTVVLLVIYIRRATVESPAPQAPPASATQIIESAPASAALVKSQPKTKRKS